MEPPNDYYTSRKSHLLKEFDRSVRRIKPVLAQYAGDQTDALIVQTRQEYEALIPQLPYVGGTQPFTQFMIFNGCFLAMHRVLKAHGWTVEETGRLVYRIGDAFLKTYPRFVLRFLGRRIFARSYVDAVRKRAAESQKRQYPGSWVAVFVEGDGKEFDYGVDYIECGSCKFLAKHGALELTPYLCPADILYSEAYGWGLIRTKTLAEGYDRCDFRFKKGSKTRVAVPAALRDLV